jgi:hypothetical protein
VNTTSIKLFITWKNLEHTEEAARDVEEMAVEAVDVDWEAVKEAAVLVHPCCCHQAPA